MPLFLVEPDSDLTIEVALPAEVEQSWVSQVRRMERSPRDRRLFASRLSRLLTDMLPDALDWDLKEPTKNQIAFAKSLCRQLKVEIPSEAFASRGNMHAFIEQHARELKEQ